jgi:hypothetical protein
MDDFWQKLYFDTIKAMKITEKVSKKRSRPTDEVFEKILLCEHYESEDESETIYSESPYYESFNRNWFSCATFKHITEDEFYENQRKYKCLVISTL